MKERILLAVSAAVCAGCASTPSVVYKKIDRVADGSAAAPVGVTDMYYLNASAITIAPVARDALKKEPLTYAISSDPIESTDFKVGIIPKNSVFSTTKINITKAENSDRVAASGVETTDNLQALISTIGGIAAKTVPMVAAGRAGDCKSPYVLTKPLRIDLTGNLDEEAIVYRLNPDDSSTSCITVKVGPLPPEAIKVEAYPWGVETSNYYYSACRNADVTVTYPDGRSTSKSLRVADPRYVQYVQYPYKGSITMHSQCGVSVKTESVANPLAGLNAFAEFIKQVDAVKNAK